MIAQITIIVKIQDQHVVIQQDYFIMQNQNHDPNVTHHVELACKGHLIVFQHAINFYIEYQKEQHVYLYRTLYNFWSLLSQLFNFGCVKQDEEINLKLDKNNMKKVIKFIKMYAIFQQNSMFFFQELLDLFQRSSNAKIHLSRLKSCGRIIWILKRDIDYGNKLNQLYGL